MNPGKRLLLSIALTLMWSPSFLFIKLAVTELPPITVVSLRVSLAALLLYSLLRWRGRTLPTDRSFWFHSTIMAFFSSAFPFCLFCVAEQTIDSALAAMINGTAPIYTAMLAQIFIPSDRMNLQKATGMLISSMGLVLLFVPNILEGLTGTTVGILTASLATICYAISHVYGKKFMMGQPRFVAPTAQFALSALMLTPLAFLFEAPLSLEPPSIAAISGVCGLALFGTFFAFIIYYHLLDKCGPTSVAMVSYFFPVGGMVLGYLFLGEHLSWSSLCAAALILIGMMVVNQVISLKFLRILQPQRFLEPRQE
jgi:drug/metabolite transporter (DMT)-like permease